MSNKKKQERGRNVLKTPALSEKLISRLFSPCALVLQRSYVNSFRCPILSQKRRINIKRWYRWYIGTKRGMLIDTQRTRCKKQPRMQYIIIVVTTKKQKNARQKMHYIIGTLCHGGKIDREDCLKLKQALIA